MAKILLVEDDRELGCMISTCLAFDHYFVECVADGDEAIARLKLYGYDLILLDWELPKVSGIDICRRFRDFGGNTPILMVTARSKVTEKTEGLDSGADDYLTKPFDMAELSSRVRALLRRSGGKFRPQDLQFEDIVLVPTDFLARRAGVDLLLSAKEFVLLEFFMRHPGRIFSADALINHVWRAEENPSLESVRQHIMNLRRKLESGGRSPVIQTIRGVGYKLDVRE